MSSDKKRRLRHQAAGAEILEALLQNDHTSEQVPAQEAGEPEYGMVPFGVVKDATLSRGALRLMVALCAYRRNGEGDPLRGLCWPSTRRLARDLGVSDRTVRRSLRELEERGWVIVRKRRDIHPDFRGHPDAHSYEVLWEKTKGDNPVRVMEDNPVRVMRHTPIQTVAEHTMITPPEHTPRLNAVSPFSGENPQRSGNGREMAIAEMEERFGAEAVERALADEGKNAPIGVLWVVLGRRELAAKVPVAGG